MTTEFGNPMLTLTHPEVPVDQALSDGLKSLHTAAIDARNGYTEALADAEGSGMTPLFKDMIALHSQNAMELGIELQKLGEKPDDSGSFMSTVHRTIISVRSLFDGLGKSVLTGLIDGENRNVHHYNDVLNEPGAPTALTQVLTAERGRIQAAIVRMQTAEK
jgi:uncharacterized protein (TIGR02284 family)